MTAPVQRIENSLSSYVRKVLIFLRLKGSERPPHPSSAIVTALPPACGSASRNVTQ